jgi:hypothetical protein
MRPVAASSGRTQQAGPGTDENDGPFGRALTMCPPRRHRCAKVGLQGATERDDHGRALPCEECVSAPRGRRLRARGPAQDAQAGSGAVSFHSVAAARGGDGGPHPRPIATVACRKRPRDDAGRRSEGPRAAVSFTSSGEPSGTRSLTSDQFIDLPEVRSFVHRQGCSPSSRPNTRLRPGGLDDPTCVSADEADRTLDCRSVIGKASGHGRCVSSGCVGSGRILLA